jgi:2-amino-4-hydroxy-6-hydroxymethyldihydropteridine diphosphokinase/dihydropteroate synthase
MIVISLGSNLGDRFDNLRRAIAFIKQRCLQNVRESIVIETEALLPEHAHSDWNKPFLNMIICGETALSPQELLNELKTIEKKIGRPDNYERWSPRLIDLDILLYNDLTLSAMEITIPHPEIKNRPFLKHLLSLMNVKNWTFDYSENSFTRSYVLKPELVGIVNITTDSFSDGGKFYTPDKALQQALHCESHGASFIELGAQSTRPGALLQPAESEYIQLDKVLSTMSEITDKQLKISIDTFHPSIALKLLKTYQISIINDVKGNFDDDSLRKIAKSGCKFCLMHSITIPHENEKVIPQSEDTLDYLIKWGNSSLKKLKNLGFSNEDIILDPGIGFGKTPYQNIQILKNIHKLKGLGCQIMVGHSRKSYIRAISAQLNAHNRDTETIAISLALEGNVDFLRIHTVEDHMKALVAHSLFKNQS